MHLLFVRGDDAIAAATLGQVQRLVRLPERVFKTLTGCEVATPKLAVMGSGSSGMKFVCMILCRSFSARSAAFARLAPGHTSTNSSPPQRPTASVLRVLRAQDLAHRAQHPVAARSGRVDR